MSDRLKQIKELLLNICHI